MPFVLKNKKDAQLFSCKLINIYEFEYYGVKQWDFYDDAEAEIEALLQKNDAGQTKDWEIVELEEHQMKMCNVKLNNNANRRVYLTDEGALEVRSAQS